MFEKLKNLITFLFYFSISVPFIAYAFTRILINLIFQSINVLLLGINYGTYSLESYLAKQLKNNTRTAYQTLGKHTTAYGFIFIKNIPFYALKTLHATLIIAYLLPLHIMVQSFAFLARKINLPTAENLMFFVSVHTGDDEQSYTKFFTGEKAENSYWIFNQLARFDFWVSKNFYITKNKLVILPQKESNVVNTSTDWIRKSLYKLNYITSVFKLIVPFITSIVGFVVQLTLVILFFVEKTIILDILGIESIQLFFQNLLEILFCSVSLLFGGIIFFTKKDSSYTYDRSLLYASFIALEYFVIRAIDTITEIVSVPFRFLSQALYTLYELFTDQDFDYRKFDDSLHSYQLEQSPSIETINSKANIKIHTDTFTKRNIDTNDEASLMAACKNN